MVPPPATSRASCAPREEREYGTVRGIVAGRAAFGSFRAFAGRAILVAGAVLLAWLLWRVLRGFTGPLLWAALLAFLLHPANVALRGRLRGRRSGAALLLTIAVTAGIVVPGVLLGTAFARQVVELRGVVDHAARQYHVARFEDLARLPVMTRPARWIAARAPVSTEQIDAWIAAAARTAVEFLLARTGAIVLGAAGALLGLLLTLFLLFFFFRDGDAAARRLELLLPGEADRKRHLIGHVAEVTRAVVYGSLSTAALQGLLVGIAFRVFGLPSPVVFGSLAALCSLLPAGTVLVWGPAAAALAIQGRWGAAIGMTAWGALLVVAIVDTLVRPLVVSGRVEVSFLPVFLGVLGGLEAFGPIGIFLGPVLIAFTLELARTIEEERAGARPP
jgi:predicted PurR-regulated permease PerM